MIRKYFAFSFAFCFMLISMFAQNKSTYLTQKPFTRWWWFASQIDTNEVKDQLDWLKKNNFGGVEIAFIYPYKGDTTIKKFTWLSPEWSAAVAYAKKYSDKIGLGCDFTFGTLWPFGDSNVPEQEGTRFYGDSISKKTMRLTWETPRRGRVLDHLSRNAFNNYAARVGGALKPALGGKPCALFCDSWEVETKKLWTQGFDQLFTKKFGYDIKPYMDSLYSAGYEDYFYDYTKLTSELVLNEFYKPFTEYSHSVGAFSRAQCSGAPADLLTAYSLVDVPESEAILYEPRYTKIPVSSAILSSKKIISSEAFTCAYGWKGWPGPGPWQKKEQVADLKLISDALFAHGVNMIFWHGMPFNGKNDTNRFYASVHIGKDAAFVNELPAFNTYLEKVSAAMQKGKPYSELGVYLPLEDSWMGVEYPDSLQFPWVWGEYELRYISQPLQTKGYQPVWVNDYFLKKGKLQNKKLLVGDAVLSSLIVDVNYLDLDALKTILNLAKQGFKVCLLSKPKQPGKTKNSEYPALLEQLIKQPSCTASLKDVLSAKPLIEGIDLPDFFARETEDGLSVFFSGPEAINLTYPLTYGQAFTTQTVIKKTTINYKGNTIPVTLSFAPYQSLLLKVKANGTYQFEDVTFVPSTPVVNKAPVEEGAVMWRKKQKEKKK